MKNLERVCHGGNRERGRGGNPDHAVLLYHLGTVFATFFIERSEILPTEGNEVKRPLEETVDDAIKRALQGATCEDRSVDQKLYEVLKEVFATLTDLIGGDPQITLHPAFSAGYVTIKVSDVKLNTAEVATLRSALVNCTALSIEPLSNGNVEVGVTVPNVFSPLESGTTE